MKAKPPSQGSAVRIFSSRSRLAFGGFEFLKFAFVSEDASDHEAAGGGDHCSNEAADYK